LDPASVAAIVVLVTGLVFGTGLAVRPPRRLALSAGPIDQLVDGEIGAVEGEVVATGPLLRSPITETPCVYWQLTFDEVGAGDWVQRARLQHHGEFIVDVGGVRVRVLAHGARIDVPPHHIARRAGYGGPVSSYDLVMAQARAAQVRFAYATSLLRATEWIVTPGMLVRVQGGCTLEPDPDAVATVQGYREGLPTRPVLSGTRRAPLLIATHR
jgi:hypothetical protein